jgi:TonB family protein
MKKITLLLLLLCPVLLSTLHAQRAVKKYYEDQMAEGETFISGTMQAIFIKTKDGQIIKKTFYPEKKALTHYMTYTGRDMQLAHGPYKEWFDNGRLWKEGQYENGLRSGTWTIYPFHSKGGYERGAYEMGTKEGLWVAIDSLGNTVQENNYEKGKLHGITKLYNKKGELYLQQTYEQGALVEENVFPTSIPADTAQIIEVMPMMKACINENVVDRKMCSDRLLLESIYKNINYPRWARNNWVEGTALISFVVEKDGRIGQITTLRGLCEDIEAESIRVIRQLPKWNPGRQNGEAVKVQFNLPIKYRLE